MLDALKRWAVGIGAVVGTAVVVMTASAPRAHARAFTYSTKLQTIRVGVLLPNRNAYSDNTFTYTGTGVDLNHAFSYVFHALNARPDLRPYGWEIVNPHSAPFMDEGMARRYGVTFNPANPPRINKNMAVYWEVFLHDASMDQLSDYDVLYMPMPLNDGTGSDQLTVQDREKLRRAVDGGTILWMDNVSGAAQPSPSAGKLFVTPAFQRIGGGVAGLQTGDPMDGLLNTPFAISARESRQIGLGGQRTRIADAPVDNRSDVTRAWKPVLWAGTTSNVTAAAFSYGQGAVILTGGGIGRKLSQGFQPVQGVDDTASGSAWRARNTGPVSGSNPRFVSVSDLKFMVNILAYRFQSPQTGAGPRHSSGSRQDLDTPLGAKWKQQVANGAVQMRFASDPAVWNGIAYAATWDGYLRAYDMDPGRDIDGDGNPDDGMPDPPGTSADIIWQSKLPASAGGVSSLTVGTVNGEAVVYGMLASGQVFAARALQFGIVNGRRRLLPTTNIKVTKVFDQYPILYDYFSHRLSGTGSVTVPMEFNVYHVPAPVFYNGRLFVVGIQQSPPQNTGIGGLAEIDPDPTTLTVRWQFPKDTLGPNATVPAQSRMGIPSATPTVAAIPDKGYADATDILLLVPTLSVMQSDPNSNGVVQPSRVMAFPLGVRGERLLYRDPDVFLTRFANANAIRVDDSTVRLWAPDGRGSAGKAVIDRVAGYPRLGLTATTPIGTDDIRADYDFVPGLPSNDFQGYNARWSFDAWSYVLGSTQRFMEILTSPVVSTDGGVYWVASDVGYGGNQAPMVMGVEMRQQRLPASVENNPQYLAPLNQPQLTFLYTVGQTSATGQPTDAPIRQPIVMGTPAVDRGILYAAWGWWAPDAGGTKASRGGVAGFTVRNTRFGLLLQNPVDDKQKGSISVVQRNRYTGDFQQVGYGLFDVENVSIGNQLRGLLVFRTLSAGPGSPPIDLSRYADIQVSYQALDVATGQTVGVTAETPVPYFRSSQKEGADPSILVAFDTTLDPTSNPLVKRGGIRTGVTVAGGSIYVGSDDGQIWTVPLPTELERLQGVPPRLRPATFPPLANAAGYTPANYPEGAEVRANPVIASNSVVQNAPVGVYSFYSPRTLITDNDRIVEVVSTYRPTGTGVVAGSAAVWSLDSTTQTRDFGRPGAGPGFEPWGDTELPTPIEKPLKQPTMAVRVNTTNTLICDTGNNRVVEVDRSGRVVWECTEFADPYGLLGANESRTLSSPTSVQRWESFTFDEDNVGVRSVHNLIADYGNNRVLEIVSRYSRDPQEMANNVVVWVGHGPSGTAYQFYQAQRLPYRPAANDPDAGSLDFGRTIASVTNMSVNGADAAVTDLPNAVTNRAATPGGSIVLLGGAKDGAAASGRVVYYINTMNYGSANSQVFGLARPVFFQSTVIGAGPLDWRLMLTDGQNIFDLVPEPGNPGRALVPTNPARGEFPIVANLPLGQVKDNAAGSGGYTVGTSMAKRLENGNILMVNQKTGYVFEFLAPQVLNATNPKDLILFTAPPLEGTTALDRPIYADRIF